MKDDALEAAAKGTGCCKKEFAFANLENDVVTTYFYHMDFYRSPEIRPNFGKPTPTEGDDATPAEVTTDNRKMLEVSPVDGCSFGVVE